VRITLPFGKDALSISLPGEVVGRILRPRSLPPVKDVGAELGKEFKNEYCRSFLARVEKKARTRNDLGVSIVVNDYTRPTPLHFVLPPLLDTLNRRGVRDSQIHVVDRRSGHPRVFR